ncbi:MAG: GNAT family N-acetyltransferase [Caulobacteraceae bacterium]
MHIETERLILSGLTPDDAAFILELVNEPGWLIHIGDRNIHGLEAARAYIGVQTANYTAHGLGMWRVGLKSSGEAIGLCGLLKRETLDHPDVGFAFLARHHRQGYAHEAAQATIEHARSTLKLPRVLGFTAPANHASAALLEKLGMRFQGMQTWPSGPPSRLFALDC